MQEEQSTFFTSMRLFYGCVLSVLQSYKKNKKKKTVSPLSILTRIKVTCGSRGCPLERMKTEMTAEALKTKKEGKG